MVQKLISDRIPTSEGGELGSNPAAIAGWVKSFFFLKPGWP